MDLAHIPGGGVVHFVHGFDAKPVSEQGKLVVKLDIPKPASLNCALPVTSRSTSLSALISHSRFCNVLIFSCWFRKRSLSIWRILARSSLACSAFIQASLLFTAETPFPAGTRSEWAYFLTKGVFVFDDTPSVFTLAMWGYYLCEAEIDREKVMRLRTRQEGLNWQLSLAQLEYTRNSREASVN